MIDYSNGISNRNSKDLLDKYIPQICNDEYMFFLNKPNVVGVGFGFKCVKNTYTKEKCIAVFVEKKIPSSLLNPCNIIPKLYKGIKTDVIEVGTFSPLSLDTRVRPVTGGYSISAENSFLLSGTLGCLVTDNTDIYLLSNNHILAGYNNIPIGTEIIQPSLADKGNPSTDTVATLFRFIPIKFQEGEVYPENFTDCAIAKPITPKLVSPIITFVGIPKGVIPPQLGAKVKKVGKSTDLTTGTILYINFTKKYKSLFGNYLMKDCIISDAMAAGGDSGSLLLDENNYAIGLLMGSSSLTSYTSFCPITTTLDSLGVSLVTN